MNTDWKRFYGPKDSFRPAFESKQTSRQRTERDEQEIRLVDCSVGVIGKATGSARLSVSEEIEIECAVYGPRRWDERETGKREALAGKKGLLEVEIAFAPFALDSFHRRDEKDLEVEEKYSRLIRDSIETAVRLEEYPQSTVSVFIFVLRGGWNDATISCAINSASVSLLDGCISMSDIVTSTAFSQCDTEETVLFDPTEDELRHSTRSGLVCWMNTKNKYTQLKIDGKQEDLFGILEVCVDNCVLIFERIKEIYKQTNSCDFE